MLTLDCVFAYKQQWQQQSLNRLLYWSIGDGFLIAIQNGSRLDVGKLQNTKHVLRVYWMFFKYNFLFIVLL